MNESIAVSPERVVDILCRDPLGAALWRAAANEALADAYRERCEQLLAEQAAQRAEDKQPGTQQPGAQQPGTRRLGVDSRIEHGIVTDRS